MTTTSTMSLREGAASDNQKKLSTKLTGWGIVSKKRTNPESTTQKRKRNAKQNKKR